ncbi:UNVERIFIED_CONTAM: protein trichome birefringence-like 25 [Sesamum angustifolium]|uniref:Protein trichome birefringence-like 25 n=1 Tax=Sesamum angustifolium TaxID=2727405 RepID=A0AAW2JM17_9LAMI
MKQLSGNVQRKTFSSVLVKFAVCFLVLGLAYRLFSSSLLQFSPVFVGNDEKPGLSVAKTMPPQVVAEPPPEITDDPFLNLDDHAPENVVAVYALKGKWCVKLTTIILQVEKAAEVYHDEPYRNRRWSFPSYKFTVSLFWSPFLTKAHTFEDDNGVSTGLIQLHLDELDTLWTKQIENLDYVIIAGGKWFLKSALYYENNTLKAINSVLKFIIGSKKKALFRTLVPDHFENGEWNTGGYCNRTRPFKEGEIEINDSDEIMRRVELEEFQSAAAEIGSANTMSLELFDATLLSLLRPDGHPGVYRQFHPNARIEKNANAKIQNDCLHWCLPGPIDSWNDLMLDMLLKDKN